MSFKRPSAAKQTTQTAGPGTLTLIANAGDTRSIQDALGTGPASGRFMLRGQGYFEMFRGTFTAPDQLTRDQTIKSSNSDNPVSIPPGTTDVYLLDYAHFLVDRFSANKTLDNTDGSDTWVFTGTSAANLTLPAISTALPDFWGFIDNVGNAPLTLLGNGSDTLDETGVTSLVIYPGQSGFIFLDVTGAVWRFVRTGGKVASNPNKIINGGHKVDQRNNGSAIGGAGGFVTDRWIINLLNVSGQAPSCFGSADCPSGFLRSLALTVTGTGAAPASNAQCALYQKIDGSSIIDLAWGTAAAKPVTLSFWVKSSVTGNFGVFVRNDTGLRSFVTTYTINAANTWEFKTISIPGDTSGTWVTSVNVAAYVAFDLGTGSTLSLAVGAAWQATGAGLGVSGATKLVATSNAEWRMTGCKLEAGSVATPYVEDEDSTLWEKCQRFYEKSYNLSTSPGDVSGLGCVFLTGLSGLPSATYTNVFGSIRFLTRKRAPPSVVLYAPVSGTIGKARDITNSADVTASVDNIGATGCHVLAAAAGAATGVSIAVHYTADSEI